MTKVGRLVVVRHGAREPQFHCLLCGAEFYDGEHRAYETHVSVCSRDNEDMLREASLRTKAPELFDPLVAGDPERERWVRAHRRAIIDGTVRM